MELLWKTKRIQAAGHAIGLSFEVIGGHDTGQSLHIQSFHGSLKKCIRHLVGYSQQLFGQPGTRLSRIKEQLALTHSLLITRHPKLSATLL